MKIFDKFLKLLKTDRNTFLTYILTLITAYIVVDRLVEILLMIFTGMSVSYWGPIKYTLAIACPIFAFLFSGSSKFNTSDKMKYEFFDVYTISLYIIVISMFTQWVNAAGWLLFLSVPNYPFIVSNFSYLVKPAFSAISLLLPITTFYSLIKWLIAGVHDSKDMMDSIADYGGIDLSDKSIGVGPYTCEIQLCKDCDSGKTIKLSEEKRFYQMLVVGVSGAGKTSLIYEPMIARDIDKKFFFHEVSKEMGFTALKTGLATLNSPYDNEYLNKNFNLNMLQPVEKKVDIFNSYMKKMILSKSNGKYVYRNLGLTYICPDYDSIGNMVKIADSYKLPYNIIDPNNPNSVGLNPFVYDDPLQTAISISSILKQLYASTKPDTVLAFRENAAAQAVESVCILLKEMYPILHDGDLPTLEDVLDLLTDFDLIEALCNKMEKEEEDLAIKYSSLLKYFRKFFYSSSTGRDEMEKYVTAATTELDKFLKFPGIKNILCNRTNNLNYDKALENGEIIFACTRRGDLGPSINSAFGLFFLLSMQYSVLRRPGTEKTRVPHFLYIDDLSGFINEATEPMFTLYRKYRVATILSIQNLSQLGTKYRQTILANCNNKIVFGNNTPEDNDWWSLELGEKKEWDSNKSYNTAEGTYDQKLMGIDYKYKTKYKPGKIQVLKFKQCIYKIKDLKGKNEVGKGALDFLSSSFGNPKKIRQYNFSKFVESSVSNDNKDNQDQYDINNVKHQRSYHFKDDIPNEINPVQTDTSDSKFLFDNEDAIVINLKKKKKNDDE